MLQPTPPHVPHSASQQTEFASTPGKPLLQRASGSSGSSTELLRGEIMVNRQRRYGDTTSGCVKQNAGAEPTHATVGVDLDPLRLHTYSLNERSTSPKTPRHGITTQLGRSSVEGPCLSKRILTHYCSAPHRVAWVNQLLSTGQDAEPPNRLLHGVEPCPTAQRVCVVFQFNDRGIPLTPSLH